MEAGDAVEFVGEDDADLHLFRGHPGRVYEARPEVIVGFVDGPSVAFDSLAQDLQRIPEAEYLRRGDRLVRRLHPLDDRSVSGFLAPGNEWPEGRRPTGS